MLRKRILNISSIKTTSPEMTFDETNRSRQTVQRPSSSNIRRYENSLDGRGANIETCG